MFFFEFYKLNRRKKYYFCNDIMISIIYNFFVFIRLVMIGFRILFIMIMICVNGLCKFIFYCWLNIIYIFLICKFLLFFYKYL